MGVENITVQATELTKLGMKYLPSIAGALVFLFVAWIAAGWTGMVTQKALNKSKVDLTLSKFLAKMARWAILLLSGTVCLGIFGIQTSSFAAIIGAAGLAIGLAFQGTLSNFSAGVMLLFFRPFKVGDFISVAGEMGSVDEIELFSTTLDTPDNRRIIIPNSSIFGGVIKNWSTHNKRRVDIPVGVSYDAHIGETRKTLETALSQVTTKLETSDHMIFLKELGDNAVNWEVRVWTNANQYWDTWQETIEAIKNQLDSAKIGIPYPQMDIRVVSGTNEALKPVNQSIKATV